MRLGGIVSAVLLLSGCGAPLPASTPQCPADAEDCAIAAGASQPETDDSSSPAQGVATAEQATTVVIPAAFAVTEDDLASDGPDGPATDFPDFAPSELSRLLGDDPALAFLPESFLLDLLNLILLDDLFAFDLPFRESSTEFTYLELICRDTDIPDTYCRRLYGP